MKNEIKKQRKMRRHARITAKVQGTKERPRLAVFRSNQHIYAQLIDDGAGKVLASASDLKLGGLSGQSLPGQGKTKVKRMDLAREVGKLIAEKAGKIPASPAGKKISKVVFDRAGYKYHGNIKALAEGAREGGLKF